MRDLEHRTSNERTQSKERQLAKHSILRFSNLHIFLCPTSASGYIQVPPSHLCFYIPMENHITSDKNGLLSSMSCLGPHSVIQANMLAAPEFFSLHLYFSLSPDPLP